ncbi:MAG: eL32 family ribosomal protein [archaeon]
MKKFLRRNWKNYARLGKGRKKMQKWRKPKGRDNKMREKVRGKSGIVSIGHKNKNSNEKRITIRTLAEAQKINKGQVVNLGKMGKKKKIEIARIATQKNFIIQNLNIKRILKEENKKKDSTIKDKKSNKDVKKEEKK